VVSFTSQLLYPPCKELPVPTEQEAEWAPELVWTQQQQREIIPASPEN